MATGSVFNNDEAPRFIIKTWTKAYCVTGSGTTLYCKSKDDDGALSSFFHWKPAGLNYSPPTYTKSDGTVVEYAALAICYAAPGHKYASIAYLNPNAAATATGYMLAINNNSTANITTQKTLRFDVLYARSDLIGVIDA